MCVRARACATDHFCEMLSAPLHVNFMKLYHSDLVIKKSHEWVQICVNFLGFQLSTYFIEECHANRATLRPTCLLHARMVLSHQKRC
jgi:hypothetical protein